MTTHKNNKQIKNKRKTVAKRRRTAKRKTITKHKSVNKHKTNNKRKTRKQRGGAGVKEILDANASDFLQHKPPSIKRDWENDNHLVQFPINDDYITDWTPLAGDVKDEYSDCAQNSMTFLRIIPSTIGKKISKHVNTNRCGTTPAETISIYEKAYPNDRFGTVSVDVSIVERALKVKHATFLMIWFPLKQKGHAVIMAKDLTGKTMIIDGQKLLVEPYREYLNKYNFISEVDVVIVTTRTTSSELKRDITEALSNSNSPFNGKSNSIEPTKKRARISNSAIIDVDSPVPMEVDSPVPMEVDSPVPMEVDSV